MDGGGSSSHLGGGRAALGSGGSLEAGVTSSPLNRQRYCSRPPHPRSLALETRTTAKDSHEVTEQRFLFDANVGRRFSVGALASSDVVVTDPNVQAKQASLE